MKTFSRFVSLHIALIRSTLKDACRNFKAPPTTTTLPPKTSKECPEGDFAYWCKTIKRVDCYIKKSQCCQTCKDFADSATPGSPTTFNLFSQGKIEPFFLGVIHWMKSYAGCEYGNKWEECKNYVKGPQNCLWYHFFNSLSLNFILLILLCRQHYKSEV